MSNNYAGIDCSGLGSKANRDEATGIRYGVISQNSIQPDVMSDIWSEARDLSYEQAVEEVKKKIRAIFDLPKHRWNEGIDNALDGLGECDRSYVSQVAFNLKDSIEEKADYIWEDISQRFNDRYEDNGDRSWLWEKDGYTLSNCLQSDVFVSKSPYFTYASFCSPCCPGAGNLDSPCESGPKTFALGPDFFDAESPCPYPIYRVSDGTLVDPGTDESKTAP